MRLHVFQHVPFEGPGIIAEWAREHGHALAIVRVWADALPAPESVEMLVIMGGPMSVHDAPALPWLQAEKDWLRGWLARGRPVLGICLGGQLLAERLGGDVTPGAHREIGWFPVTREPALADHPLGAVFPESVTALHWHGETFSIPPGALRIGSSAACANQGFVLGPAVALQFHFESTPASVHEISAACAGELTAGGPWVQSPEAIAEGALLHGPAANTAMRALLDWLAAQTSTPEILSVS